MNYLDLAILAAKEAGKIHKKYFKTGIKIKEKTNSFDLVTNADLEAEEKIISLVQKSFPDHNFLAEEGKYQKTNSPYTWVIDPLDGTNNFSSGLTIFCVSIALIYKAEVIAGVIYDVMRDELFYAEKGKGAYLNGEKIKVSSVDEFKRALLITGFYYDRGKDMLECLEHIKKFFLKRILGLRRLGAAALDLCYVACGRVSGFWEFKLSPWDFSAGKLIIEEAGGKVTQRHGEAVSCLNNSFIVASNTKIHEKMLEVLR